MKKNLISLSLLFYSPLLLSATAIDLEHVKPSALLTLFSTTKKTTQPILNLEPTNQSVDFNQTTHIRYKQTFSGYPVWGGEAIVHIPQRKGKKMSAIADPAASMNGIIYEDLEVDLQSTPSFIFTKMQAEKALSETIKQYQALHGTKGKIESKKSELMVYIDQHQKAHWAFNIHLYIKYKDHRPEIPVYLIDAANFSIVYRNWDDMRSAFDAVKGGGYGGNLKMGKLSYDDLAEHLPSLMMERDPLSQTCYLKNAEVLVSDFYTHEYYPVTFPCLQSDPIHNNLYWDGARDEVNGGYSPEHDALYAGQVINAMYQTWYHIPPLINSNGTPMQMHMVAHFFRDDNAYWDTQLNTMYFGDGRNLFYPLTSLGVAAHEISHGFTQQHSDLYYEDQSGGMNESFSDMASAAVEYYKTGKNTWALGTEIIKTKFLTAMRYMDQPSKDCKELQALGMDMCSIDSALDYDPEKHAKRVHYTSGVYNRAFYLLATTPGWDTRKAFDVMVQANAHYWTSHSTFTQGACGVIHAAKDYGYDAKTVGDVFKAVGIEVSGC